MRIAHRFNGGFPRQRESSPEGTKEFVSHPTLDRTRFGRPCGTWNQCKSVSPALKRWAIFGCPSGAETGIGHLPCFAKSFWMLPMISGEKTALKNAPWAQNEHDFRCMALCPKHNLWRDRNHKRCVPIIKVFPAKPNITPHHCFCRLATRRFHRFTRTVISF